MRPTSWTTPRSSARSARSTRPSGARRSKKNPEGRWCPGSPSTVSCPRGAGPGLGRPGARARALDDNSAMTYQRLQGRAADALRPVTTERRYTRHAEGSVLIAFGDTQVLCTASVEEKVPPHKRGSGEGWVTAEDGMRPRSTH